MTTTTSSAGAGGADGGGTGGSGGSGGGGVLAGKACVDGLIPLSDTFTTGISADSWSASKDDQHPVGIDYTGGLVSLDIPLGPGITWGGVVVSSSRYDMRNCAAFVEAPAVPLDASVYMNLVVKLDPKDNFVEFTYQKKQLQFKYTINSVATILSLCDTAYNAKLHRYWRIRVNAGTTYWESSADTKTWAMLCSKQISFPYEYVIVGFGAGTSVAASVDAGASSTASFDNFNVLLP